MTFPLHITLIAATLCFALQARADAVSDAIAAAAAAYDSGDLATASAQLTQANKEIATRQSAQILALFPPAPDGWARTDNPDMAEGMAIMGGGSGAEATYTNPEGNTVTISTFADNLMVQSMTGILANPAMIAMMGGAEDIGGVAFLTQDGSLSGLIENRVMVQANGDVELARTLLALFDFAALGKLGAP